MIPPTYIGYNLLSPRIETIINNLLMPYSHRAISASGRLPLKTLAVRSGLCEYGRNNIPYAAGMGSFLQLTAFFSDLPCLEDSWRDPVMLSRCQKCNACTTKCPTRAIASDRFLLHAEQCLVYFNERPPEFPIPTWIAQTAYNSLIGCMTCQQVCPEDRSFIDQFASQVVFTEAETSLLLQDPTVDQLPVELSQKLGSIDMLNDLALVPRNLRAFF
jgi:epoxyqueuosine reductase